MSSTNRAQLLQDLKERLLAINNNRLALNHKYSISLNSLTSISDKIKEAKDILERYGVLFITDAIPPAEVNIIKESLVDAHNTMFGKDMHDIQVNTVEDIPRMAKAGILGNKGFAYLYKQPLAKSATPTAKIGNYPVYIDHNPVYRLVNIATLLRNRPALEAILELTHQDHVMISPDSAKVSINPKSKANPFTVPHLDAYGAETERFQIILTVEENRTKLFYAPGTIDSEVRNLLIALQADQGLYTVDGFKALQADVAEVIRPFMICAPPLSLSFWKSGIVHAEYTSTASPNSEGLYQPDPAYSLSQFTNQLTIRLVVGTHIPVKLTDIEKMQLAIMAEEGFITSRYLHGPHKNVVLNKMHKGKTQYKVSRKQPQKEKDLAKATIAKVEDISYVKQRFAQLDPLLQHLYGIPVPQRTTLSIYQPNPPKKKMTLVLKKKP